MPPPPTHTLMNDGFMVPPPPNPPSAADKLLQLMANQRPQNMAPHMPVQPPSFNFTYVEEGKAPSSSTMVPTGFLPLPMMMPGYGQMHPLAHMAVPYGMRGVGVIPPENMLPPRGTAATSSRLISEEDFPPLGGDAPKAKDGPSISTPVKLVPSNVKAN